MSERNCVLYRNTCIMWACPHKQTNKQTNRSHQLLLLPWEWPSRTSGSSPGEGDTPGDCHKRRRTGSTWRAGRCCAPSGVSLVAFSSWTDHRTSSSMWSYPHCSCHAQGWCAARLSRWKRQKWEACRCCHLHCHQCHCGWYQQRSQEPARQGWGSLWALSSAGQPPRSPP